MGFLKCVCTFQHVNGLPDDTINNDWYFITDNPAPYTAGCSHILSMLIDFYNKVYDGGSGTVAGHMSPTLSRVIGTWHFEFTDVTTVLGGEPAGSPFRIDAHTLGTPSGTVSAMPSEVAAVLSYHGAYGTLPEVGPNKIRPKQRKRGRVFIGPLTNTACEISANSRVVVASPFRAILIAAATAMMSAGNNDAQWAQWSRANRSFSPVVGGHVDDALDTQRRRGEEAILRSTWGPQ